MTGGARAGWAGSAAVLAPAALLATLVLVSLWVAPPPEDRQWTAVWELVTGTGFAAAGGAVVARHRRSAPGRLFLVAGVLLLVAPLAVAIGRPGVGDATATAAVALVVPLALLRVARPERGVVLLRGLEAVLVVAGTTAALAAALAAGDLALAAVAVAGLAVLGAGWLQFELSDGQQRRRVLWLVLGVCSAVPTTVLFLIAVERTSLAERAVGVVAALLSLLLPTCAATALLAPDRLDVREVITRAVLFVVMTTLAVAVFRGGEAGVELLTGTAPSGGTTALLAAAIAAGFHPVAVRVRSSVDELLFGGRADAVDAMTRLASELAAGSSPREWLDAVRGALAVSGVALRKDGETIAGSGVLDPAHTTVTPLRAGPDHVGELVVTLHANQLRLNRPTRAVLALLAAPLAQALQAIRLGEQLQASRRRVVTALEEERRRVRRDLHDGLGPTLTGIAYSADAAVNLVRADTDQAVQVLRGLRADAGDAISEIRRIVHGLRPRALDELGLVGAVRQRVAHLRTPGGEPLTVRVDVADPLPELAAAVEVAAYRVAIEGVTNVARHAGVDTATIGFTVVPGPTLRITVQDGGRSEAAWKPGVGLSSMRERVEEIGGTLALESGPHGATVTADLPLAPPT